MKFFLLFLLATGASCSQQFQCNFEMRDPGMPGAFVNGVLKYDFISHKMLYTYTSSKNKELYSFNQNGGYGTSNPFSDQYVFKWSDSCPCSVTALTNSQPVLFVSPTYLKPTTRQPATNQQTTTVGYEPVMPGSGLDFVVFGDSGFPSRAIMTSGQAFTFSGCKELGVITSSEWTPPSDCSCGKLLDVVMVLDRSSSIDLNEYKEEKKFVQNFVASFSYSPLGVNLGITNFHAFTWDGPVTLAQGNNDASVKAGASALQCYPNAQCLVSGRVPSGSCCGMGTSISAGIVNGADMLASVPNTGARKDLSKVLIVLTDGVHNRVLKKDSLGNLVRDSAGKPLGVKYTVNGVECYEDTRGQSTCSKGLEADLDWAINYAIKKVPKLSIFSIGVGLDMVDPDQLLRVARGIKSNVFLVKDWAELSGIVRQLSSMACQQSSDDSQCKNCCGFCSCSGCIPPDGCDNPENFCDQISIVGTCCKSVPKPPGSCDEPDKCRTFFCDRNLNNGVGGCSSTVNPIKPNTPCANYTCDPSTGDTIFTDLCPPKPLCLLHSECDDDNLCTKDECVLADPDDKLSAYCRNTPIDVNCTESDRCFYYSCDPKLGCVKIAKPLPNNTNCTSHICDPKDGSIKVEDLCPQVPDCITATDCDDNNKCTDDECVISDFNDPLSAKCVHTPKPDDFCAINDKCFAYRCDPTIGCVETRIPLPTGNNCTEYECDPENGNLKTINLCPRVPDCIVDSDCNDDNACTNDICLYDPEDPENAKCVWTDLEPNTCNDNDACTRDSCVPAIGCVYEPLPHNFCDDNNACTEDICDPQSINITDPCVHIMVTCNKSDVCHETFCDPQTGCTEVDIACPVTDNCTISGCNVTDDLGCYVQSAGVCGFPIGAVAGITAGVIAGIVLAAVIGVLFVGGGAAYAFTHSAGAGLNATVENNPIYTPTGVSGNNPLFRA